MHAEHTNSKLIDPCCIGVFTRKAASLAELHRDVIGMHQEIDRNHTEEALLEELDVLTGRIDLAALAARHGRQEQQRIPPGSHV
jgi:hypothetical protein